MIWVHLFKMMNYNRYRHIILAVNNNDGDFFDILGKLVKLQRTWLLYKDLLRNFRLLCNIRLLIFAAILLLGWLLHLAI